MPSVASTPPTQDYPTKILLDSPSSGPELGFPRTALALAQIMKESSPRFSIGIFGGWGSGKTTLMRAIQRELPESIVIVEFNAWRFEREEHLLVPLLDTVRTALVDWSKARDPDTKERVRGVARRVGRVIRGLAAGLSGEVGLPGAAKVSYDVGKAVDALTTSDDSEQSQWLYVAAFRELSEAFAEFTSGGATRVAVFVDDLDRCLPSNALDVLESMKLFFDLPGFIFVVGLDEDVVQRAVRTRFPADPNAGPASASAPENVQQNSARSSLERHYVEKIFQVPYRLPPMFFEQLPALLEAMYREAELPELQRTDFRDRVAVHLRFIAVERQINPREVKRFLNTYTLQTLVRPELERDVVLPLQTLSFRYEWRTLYDAIITDSMLFTAALANYRNGDDFAFEDLSPELRVLPAGLGDYLRLDVAGPLCTAPSLDTYLSSLESAGTVPPWITESYKEIGRLRVAVRRLRAIAVPSVADRLDLARTTKEVTSLLRSISSLMGPARLQSISRLLDEIEVAAQGLERGPADNEPTNVSERDRVAEVTSEILDIANRIYRELRNSRDTLTAQSGT